MLHTGLEHPMRYLKVIFDGQMVFHTHFPIGFPAGQSIVITINNRMTMVNERVLTFYRRVNYGILIHIYKNIYFRAERTRLC